MFYYIRKNNLIIYDQFQINDVIIIKDDAFYNVRGMMFQILESIWLDMSVQKLKLETVTLRLKYSYYIHITYILIS